KRLPARRDGSRQPGGPRRRRIRTACGRDLLRLPGNTGENLRIPRASRKIASAVTAPALPPSLGLARGDSLVGECRRTRRENAAPEPGPGQREGRAPEDDRMTFRSLPGRYGQVANAAVSWTGVNA